MDSRRRVVLSLTIALLVAAAVGESAQAGVNAKAGRLVAFNSCPALLTYAKAHATPYVSAYGFGQVSTGAATRGAVPSVATATATAGAASSTTTADSTPQQGVDYSGTNVQEVGVDEPDIVKTDGKTVFVVAQGQLNAVDVTGAQPKLLDTLQLDGGWSHELLLYGTRLLVLSRGGYWAEPLSGMVARMMPINQSNSTLTEIDVSNPKDMRVVNTMTLDGSYVDARMVGSAVRIVSSSQMPVTMPFATPVNSTAAALAGAKTTNTQVIKTSRVASWLPYYRIGKKTSHAAVQCRNVLRPVSFSGLGMLTVLTIDLSKGLAPVDSVAVMTDARIVYASQSSLYVTTENWGSRPDPATPTIAPNTVMTTINKFDISDPTKTVYLGSGNVQGYLLNQWSLSEFQGVLRVVSTDEPSWWSGTANDQTQSYLTTLRQDGPGLVQVGRVGGLGQGERVYAVRFVGNTGYVVTFKQIDPLYTLDLSDPAHPAVMGELTIPGYSAYLHPIGADLLLGIGQDTDAAGHPIGTQVSLFDVSDLKHPTRLFTDSLGQGWSAVESDHHAFLYWAPTGLAVVPFGQQAVGMHVSRAGGIAELGRIVQLEANQASLPQINRSLVVGSSLLTVSDYGVKSSSLATLANVGWAAFPAPPSFPTPGAIAGPPSVIYSGVSGGGVATGIAVPR